MSVKTIATQRASMGIPTESSPALALRAFLFTDGLRDLEPKAHAARIALAVERLRPLTPILP